MIKTASLARSLTGWQQQLHKTVTSTTELREEHMRKSLTLLGAILIIFAGLGTAHADDDKLAKKGEKVFKKCKACHEVGPDAKDKVGPNLNGIIGRKAAAVEGFAYSDALKAKAGEGLVWDEENLRKFLKKPSEMVQGTNMAFSGLRRDKQIDQIMAFFKSQTKE